MTFTELLKKYGIKMTWLAEKTGIPYRTLQQWKQQDRSDWMIPLLEAKIKMTLAEAHD